MEFVCALAPVFVGLAFLVGIIAGMWKVFEKAGQPGWAAIVPIYNGYVLTCEIAKKDIVWFLVITFVPFVGLVAWILVAMEVGKKFGKEGGYGVGLALLPFIFFPMLGFSDAQYQGSSKSGGKRSKYADEDEDEGERKNW